MVLIRGSDKHCLVGTPSDDFTLLAAFCLVPVTEAPTVSILQNLRGGSHVPVGYEFYLLIEVKSYRLTTCDYDTGSNQSSCHTWVGCFPARDCQEGQQWNAGNQRLDPDSKCQCHTSIHDYSFKIKIILLPKPCTMGP